MPRIKKIFASKKDNFRQFNEWCRDVKFPSKASAFNTSGLYGGRTPTEDEFKKTFAKHNELLSANTVISATFSGSLPETGSYKLGNTNNDKLGLINVLHVTPNTINCELIFKRLKINTCHIHWGGHTKLTDPVVFENCEFVKLTLNHDARVYLKNCKIGTLEITKAIKYTWKVGAFSIYRLLHLVTVTH